MPIGTFHELVGTLRWTELGYTLYLDEGGFWVLDLPRRRDKFLNKYIIVQGFRAGFNILDVKEVRLVDLLR